MYFETQNLQAINLTSLWGAKNDNLLIIAQNGVGVISYQYM